MTKLLGSVIVFIGGGLIWYCQWKERERRRTTLADLVSALRRMQEEIRMARTPLPELLVCVAKDCGRDCSDFLYSVADGVSQGNTLRAAWRAGCMAMKRKCVKIFRLSHMNLRSALQRWNKADRRRKNVPRHSVFPVRLCW